MALVLKNPPASAGDARDAGLIPGSGRCPGGGNGNPLQCSCLENPMGRGAWRATVHEVAKSWIRLKRLSMHTGQNVRQPGILILVFMLFRVCAFNREKSNVISI